MHVEAVKAGRVDTIVTDALLDGALCHGLPGAPQKILLSFWGMCRTRGPTEKQARRIVASLTEVLTGFGSESAIINAPDGQSPSARPRASCWSCDERGEAVGAAHAGWRGLSSGVIENTVHAMNIRPDRVLAYLGPAIGPAAFEVGDDVRDAFLAHDGAASVAFKRLANGKWLADLFTLGRQRLASCGVTRVFGGTDCTVSNPQRFYSYRRDKTTGRMAALIWLTDETSAETPRPL